MNGAVEEKTCQCAEELMTVLGRTSSLWDGMRHVWTFRGHSNDTEYKLIPTALRNDKPVELGYTCNPKRSPLRNNDEQVHAEFERLHEFFWAVDAQGLHVPGDSNLLRTPKGWNELKKEMDDNKWPVDALMPLLALAQHYGVPTRLLDWSDKPLVAAYIAAKSAAKKKTLDGFLSIWALNLDWIIHPAFPGGGLNNNGQSELIPVFVTTAPRVSNPNLHAQSGVLTTEQINIDTNPVIIRPLNEIVEQKWNDLNWSKPVMARYKLHWSEAGKLLRILNQEGVNAATVFPGYKGAADALMERSDWDDKEKTSYWIRPAM